MFNQKWSLQIQCNSKKLSQSISHIFSNEYIYGHRNFRKKIMISKKGYVNIKEVVKEGILQEYFKQNNVIQLQDKIRLISIAAKECKQLVLKNNQIRRLCPFDSSLLKTIKPIYLQSLHQSKLTISDIRQYLGASFFAITEHDSAQNIDSDVKLYVPEYQKILELEESGLKLTNYENFCKQRERQSRFWHNHQLNMYKDLQTDLNRKKYNIRNYKIRASNTGSLQQMLQLSQVNKKEMIKAAHKLQRTQRQALMRDQMQQLEKNEYYLRERYFEENSDQQDDDDDSLVRQANKSFNQLLLGFIKEKQSFMERQ